MGTWRTLAACLEINTSIFWADDELAARTCQDCPVAKKCFMYAAHTRQEYGIWGGMRFDQGKPKPLKVSRYPSMKKRVHYT